MADRYISSADRVAADGCLGRELVTRSGFRAGPQPRSRGWPSSAQRSHASGACLEEHGGPVRTAVEVTPANALAHNNLGPNIWIWVIMRKPAALAPRD